MIQPKKVTGRPKKPEAEILSQRSIRMSPAQWAKVGRGGTKALRRLIDQWEIDRLSTCRELVVLSKANERCSNGS